MLESRKGCLSLKCRQKAVLSDTQEKKNTKKYHVFPSKACTTTHSGSQANVFLQACISSSNKLTKSIPLILLPYTGHQWHKTKCQHSPASLSSCSQLSQNTLVNRTYPSSSAMLRDPSLSKLAFQQSQPDSEK